MLHHLFENSSMLASCAYDTSEKELHVQFQNGKTYVYTDVGVDIYNDLCAAKSAGKYFNAIKNELKLK